MRLNIFALALLAMLSHTALANDNTEVIAATHNLYATLSNGDVVGFSRYLPPEGFTEFNTTDATMQILTAEFFGGVIKSGVQIQLRVTDASARLFGDTALVTGYRTGAIVMPNGQKLEGKQFLTMLWMKRATGWRLAHIHLSLPAN